MVASLGAASGAQQTFSRRRHRAVPPPEDDVASLHRAPKDRHPDPATAGCPPAAQLDGLQPPGLQPLLDVAPAGARPVPAHRRQALAALPQPGGRPRSRFSATGRRSSTTPTSWPSTGPCSTASTATWTTAPGTGSSASTARELDGPVAYFCAEYGLHESLGIYSGGLGVLAGDHLKAASDMALPFVGVGLFYRHGYFRQTIDADGHQEHDYPDSTRERLPLQRVAGEDGGPLRDRRRAARPDSVVRRVAGRRSAACRCCCSTRTSPTTTRPTGPSPTSCTCAAARCASTRRSSWASAACAPCARWASRPRRGISTRATRRSCSSSAPAS